MFYTNLIAFSKEAKHILLLYWIYYYVTIKQLKWPSTFLSQEVSSSQAMENKLFQESLITSQQT